MAIVKDNDGSLTFEMQGTDTTVSLSTFDSYIDSLNEYDTASCIINKNGELSDNNIQGIFVESKPGKFGIIIGTEFNPIVYRGLNNDYVFMPDSLRYELFDPKERIRHCINWVKKHEFLNLLSQTPYIKRPQKFKVLDYSYDLDLEAIAKHYNYMSDYIDVTRNMMVAYFFAYTYYDKEKNQYFPIEKFEYNSPTLYACSLKDLYRKVPESVKNICWQPMLRSNMQQTMSINVSKDWDVVQSVFKKVELPKNPEISRYVYNLFDGGKLLFPTDYAGRCAIQIREYKTLHEDLIIAYCEETKTDITWLKEELTKLNYEFVNQPWYIPEQANSIINNEIDEKILAYLDNGFIYRAKKAYG